MNKARDLYTQVPKIYNCAQAIVAAAEQDDLIEPMKDCGGGRAPHGVCGALHAVLTLTPKEEHDNIIKQFVEKTQSALCHELKTVYKTPCADCVEYAYDILKSIK